MADKNRLANYFLGEEYEPNNKPSILPAYKEPPRKRPPTRASLAQAKINIAKQASTKTLRSGKRLRNNNTKKNTMVKFMKSTSVSKTNIDKAAKFQKEIESLKKLI